MGGDGRKVEGGWGCGYGAGFSKCLDGRSRGGYGQKMSVRGLHGREEGREGCEGTGVEGGAGVWITCKFSEYWFGV